MNAETSKGRLQEYLNIKGISKSEFYRSTGLNRGLIDTDKLHQSLSSDKIAIIVGVYTDLNIDWLITGKGPMLLQREGEGKEDSSRLSVNPTLGDERQSICSKSIVQRISLIAQNEAISTGVLEQKIGASKGVLSHAIKNGTDIQAKWLTKIIEIFPSYSAHWLLTGKEEAFLIPQECKEEASGLKILDVLNEQIRRKDEQIQELQKALNTLIEKGTYGV